MRKIFTKEQIDNLRKNPNVFKCSEKSITYTTNFKIRAVRERLDHYMTIKDIFLKAGFDLSIIGELTPKWRLTRWIKIYQKRGMERLAMENRGRLGGRPRKVPLSDKDKIKRLETEVAYLKAENDFLAKLRARRAE